MGHFNATCNLSNLPIFEGNKIVVIPLINVDDEASFNCCYPTDNFAPFAFPIFGEYNEYGGIIEPETSEANKCFLTSQTYYKRNNNVDCDESERFKEIQKPENFEDFLNEIICKTESTFVAVEDDIMHPCGYAQITFMMIHYDLYYDIIYEISNRKFGKSAQCFYDELKEKYSETLQKYQNAVSESGLIANSVKDDRKKVEALLSQLKDCLRERIVSEILCDGILALQTEHLGYFADVLLEKSCFYDEILEDTISQTMFTASMNYMRRGYLCDCGYGSQDGDMQFQLIIAKFIQKFVSENKYKK